MIFFLKLAKYKKPIKNKITDYKACKNIVKTVKNTNVTRFQKKLVRIWKNKTKEKWRWAICLTERTFIHKAEDKYDQKSKVRVYPSFLLTDVIKENGDLLRKL